MKKLTILLFLLALSISSFAQTNFYRLKIGAGAGSALAFADLQKKTLSFAGYGTFDYQFSPYINLGLEMQKGELAGGDILFDPHNRQFINSYLSASLNLKISLGEFISDYQRRNDFLNIISGLYGGVGLGIIKNKISNVRYYDIYYYPGEDKSTEEIVPFNLGINFNFPDKWGYTRYGVNINLQSTIAIGEGMDGYTPTVNGKDDIYSFFSVGIRYQFGFMGLDKRR